MEGWKTNDSVCSFEDGRWSAHFDARSPQDGIAFQLAGHPATSANAFRLSLDSSLEPPSDVYVRRRDLIASYPQSPTSPHSWLIQLRAIEGDQTDLLGIEAIFSLQTTLLDSHPRLTVDSQVLCSQFREFDNQFALGSTRQSPPLGVLTNSEAHRFSFALVSYPSDANAFKASYDAGKLKVSQTLESSFLEKGVIRRYRLLAVAATSQVPDTALLHHCKAFSESEIPLST